MTAAEVVPLLDREWMPSKPWSCPAGQLVTTSSADRQTWLIERRRGLGASDVAAIFGVSRWASPWDVWAEKTGRVQPEPENAAMLRGRVLEDGIAGLWAAHLPADEPIRLRRAGLMKHRVHGMLMATVDRLSVCRAGRCVTEIKSSVDLSDWQGDEVPVEYQLQVQQQLLVTGRDHAHVVVLGPRFEVADRVIDRDQVLIDQMVGQLVNWWRNHIVDGTEPPATATAADGLARLYGDPDPDAICDLPSDLFTAVDEIRRLDAQAKDLTTQADDLRARIKQTAGNATTIRVLGQTVATWRPSKRVAGVNAAWRKANPDLVAEYSREVTDTVLDVDRLIEDKPELIGDGQPLYRVRTLRLTD